MRKEAVIDAMLEADEKAAAAERVKNPGGRDRKKRFRPGTAGQRTDDHWRIGSHVRWIWIYQK